MSDYELWNAGLWALVPTVLVSLLFWFIMRAMLRADRTERAVYKRIEDEERAKLGLPPKA